MIKSKEVKSKYAAVCTALSEKKIKDALNQIQQLVIESHHGDLIDAHYNLEFTYKNILKYTVEGISDPERQKVYNHLIKDVYSLADKIYMTLLTQHSSDQCYQLRREFSKSTFEKIHNDYFKTLDKAELKRDANISQQADSQLQQQSETIFNWLWSSSIVSSAEKELIKGIFFNRQVYWYNKALFVSAITLSLLRSFSSEYISLLLDLVKHPDDQISARALTGLLLALYKYDSRLPLYPDLYTRLFMLAEEKGMNTLIQSVTIQLIRTRETEEIAQKLHDEIIPEVAKMQPKITEKLDLENLLNDNMMDDKNPEWKDFFEDSPNLINKLEELTQWQLEGSDVFLATFKLLKHFSFFNNIPNWMVPFFPTHPEVESALMNERDTFKNSDLLNKLAESRFLCNSDKYSLILSIPHMPDMQKDLMGNMFAAEINQMAEIEKDEANLQAHKSKLVISNQFIQDLYRLLKLHPQKNQLNDIFGQRMDFHNKWFFSQSMAESDTFREIGEFFFKKNYFEDALEIFIKILKKDAGAKDIIQKTAYCYQKLQKYDEALKHYLKADLMESGNWLKKKIALCYRHSNKTEKALEYYKEAEKIAPNNLHTQASIGACYLELGNYEEALKYYFKVEYLDQGNPKAGRPIAWCSFVLGKFDQAEKYYHKLLLATESKHDLLNLGHVLWCKKQRKEALAYYQKSIRCKDNSPEEFFESFSTDSKHLLNHGVDQADIPIMLDQIRYSLEE